MLLLYAESALALFMVFFVFLKEGLHCFTGLFLAACSDHDSHVVEKVKSVERRRCVFSLSCCFEPCTACAAAESGDLLELLIIPLESEEILELMDSIPELSAYISYLCIRYLIIRIERDIQHDHRDTELLREILIPFDSFAYARLILAYAQISFEYPSASATSHMRSPAPLAAIPAA